jgi:predicted amidohydrolase
MVRASDNACYVAPCNHGGEEFDSYMAGGSLIVDPTGRIMVQAEEDEMVICADLDRETLRQARVYSGLKDRRPDLYGMVTVPMEDLPLP